MRKKSVKLQNLNQVSTYLQESGTVSEYFNVTDFSEEMPTGRSSFLILGSRFLKENVNIKIEIIDNQGNPVYVEPVFNYEEANGIRVSVEVYQDVSEGASTLTILGEVDPTKVDIDIPSQYRGIYNVKYTRNFTITKDIPNTRPIRFYKRPGISIREVFRAKLNVDVATSGSLTQTEGKVKGVPVPNSEGRTFQPDSAEYGDVINFTDQNLGYTPIGNLTTNIGERYQFQIEDGVFSSSMQGGTITISVPVANPSFQTQSFQTVPAYSSSILEVLNKNTITVQKPFGLYNSSSAEYQISAVDPSNYSIEYPKFRTYLTSSIDFKSFAEITAHTMRTFSGDVFRIAGYVKDNGPVGNWIKIADTPIESPELLVDDNSTTGTDRTGFFRSDTTVTNYWNATGGAFGTEVDPITIQTASDPEFIGNSVFISSSVDMLSNNEETWIKLQLKDQYSSSFIAGNDYALRGKLIADNRTGQQNEIKAVAHFSGSAFNMSNQFGDFDYGRAVGMVRHQEAAGRLFSSESPEFEFIFTPDRSGTGVLQLRFTGGFWHLSDLSLRPASETNFSPDIVKLTAPIPTLKTRPDNLDFAVEFYDVNNNKSETVITSLMSNPDGISFLGENMVIAGDDSTIEGSLFLGGDTTGSGIQFGGVDSTLPETGEPGAAGSGFIRSLGYRGFTSASLSEENTGFMIYSGSVLPNSGDTYNGVGLELVGLSGSLRFSTNPSLFEVKADAFFVGNESLQFISGSEGNIEISSSAFHLDPTNNVLKVSGSITASTALIGASDGPRLSFDGSNLVVSSSDFYLGGSGQFISGSEGNIEISSSAFHLSRDGDVAISGSITAADGVIGNWNIIDGKLSGSNATLDADGAALYKSDEGPETNPLDGYYIDFTPTNANPYYVRFGSDFAVSSSGKLIASGAIIEGVLTASAGFIADWVIGSNAIHKTTDTKVSGLSSIGDTRFFAGATSLEASGSAPFNVKSTGDITGSAVLFTGGSIGGFELAATSISDTANNLILRSTGEITGSQVDFSGGVIGGFTLNATQISSSGLLLKSSGEITGSKALFDGGTIGGFEIGSGSLKNSDDTVEIDALLPGLRVKDGLGVSRVEVKSGSLSTLGGGTQYIGNKSFEDDTISAGRNITSSATSWSFNTSGHASMSLTKRSAYVDDEQAVSGDVTLDVVVPAGAGNYANNNTYEIVQVITQSIAAGDTLSFSSVARFSSSFGGKGKDRALGPQYFRMEYHDGSQFQPFLPAAVYTASNGYGEYFLGSGQYASFGGSAEIPAGTEYLKLVLTGSINDDSGFTVEKPLFVGDKGEVNSELSGKTFTKTVVGSSTPEYPETEITFDNFSVRSNTRRVELTQEGLLIYNSEDSFFKMTGAGIEFRGGSGLASFGTSINRESFTNDSQVAGTLGAPSLQAYSADPEDIGTTASDGNVADYAKGNHRHRITAATINSVLSGETLTNIFNGTFGSSAASDISGSLGPNNNLIRSLTEASITGSFTALSASLSSRIAVEEAEAGDISGVTAGSGLTGGGSSGDVTVNVGAGSGITINADDVALDTSSTRNVDHSSVSITAGSGLTGGGTIASTRTINIGAGTGITVNTDDIATNDSEIVHDDLSGFVANEHIDHSSVTITAGSGLTGGGTIAANRTINIGAGTGIDVAADAISVDVSDFMTNGQNNRIVTSTGTDAMNAETNLSFDGSELEVIGDVSSSGTGSFEFLLLAGNPVVGASVAGSDTEIQFNDGGTFGASSNLTFTNATNKLETSTGSFDRIESTKIYPGSVTTNQYISRGNGIEIHGITSRPVQVPDASLLVGTLSDGSSIGTGNISASGTGSFSNINIAGNIDISGTVDGRDLQTDGTKLDGIESSATADQSNAEIRAAVEAASDSNVFTDADHTKLNAIEASADVTDTANVTSAGALMDSELTSITDVKALDQSVISGASPTFGTANFTDASNKRLMTDAQETKLDSVESSADVTDTANVTSAGALMDSELTSITDVKALDQSVISGASPTFGTANFTDASNKRLMTDAQETKLDSVESSADVTDTANVTAAGALMDSEVTNLALVKKITDADITGSFTAASASFSTRVTSNKTKLDTIETNADVTDTANVTSAGALMDSELTSISDVKALNQSVTSGASPTFGTANFTDASDKRLMTDAQETKLDSVESSADVTDTANVTSAGALMDSELTSISDVKALDQSVISGASPTFGTANLTDATNKRLMTDAQETKLDSVESSADVTDTANVTSAGALMDSEVTNLSLVKGLTSGISNGNVLVANSVVADNDFLKIDGTSVEGRTAAEVRSDLGVESGATADQTDAEIRAAVEAATDSNVFTDDDHTKLNNIEASADVTDTANVTAAGALMDSELTSIADVKALDQSVVSGATPSFTTTNFTDATNKRLMTDAQETKLDSVESSADVTDTANVTAAGALMDSEVDADIKTLVLPASTTISAFGRTLIDDAAASNARTTLGLGSISTLSSIDISANTNLAASTGITLTGDTLTTNDSEIVHDDLSGFVANEHIDHTSVTLTAGAGLTGGGTIAANRTFAVGQGTGVTVNANDIAIGQAVGTGNSPTFAGGTLGNIKVGVTGDNELDTSSGNLTIDSAGGTITLDDNVIISGNLTVSGTETIIDSTTLNVADRIIELNAGANDGGLFVKETSGGNATGSLLYDVSENRWVAGTVGSTTNIVGTSTTDTLTNKTINASNNTLSNIANSSLSNSSVNFGGITVALGASDTTPAFDLTDADSLPIIAGTTGTLSVARGGTGATSLNNLITLSSHTTGDYVASLVAGTGIDLTNNSGEGATPTVTLDLTEVMANNSTANAVLTSDGDGTLTAETGLTYNGSTLAATGDLTTTGNITSQGDITFGDTDQISTATFTSGILGDGFRILDQGATNGTLLEVDNVVVRNTLRTHIFQKDTVKATNGMLLVSDSGVISGSTGTTGAGTVTVEDEKSATFTSGQVAFFKDAGDDGTINTVKFTFNSNGTTSGVQSGFTKYDATANAGSLADLAPGGTFARISGGTVMIDASSANSPFIDINYESGSTTARFGNLAGITSPRFGALGSNFGFWASGSAFLEGTINALSGNIGGWGIGSTAISSSGGNVTIDAAAKRITINDDSNDRIYLGEIDGGSAYGIKIFQSGGGTSPSDSDILVELGENENKIVGWELVPGRFQFNDAAGSIALDATNKQLAIYTGSIDTAKPKVIVGNLPTTGDAKYGFAVFSGSSDADISDSSTTAVLITKDEAKLAGWDLVPGRLKSGTVADINGNQASIALGTGATSATGTPTDGLFFVSASTSPVFYVGSTFSYVDDVLTAGGWKIGKGQISSSNGQAILSGSGVLSLGSGTHNYAQANRTYIDGPGNRMSIGQNFTYTSNVLTAGGWTIGNGQINDTNSRVIINATSAYISIGTGTNAYNSANRIYLDGPNAKISIGTGFRYISDALTIDGNATIAGWAIGSGAISKNDVKLDSTTNAEGLYVKKTSFSSTTAGGFLGLDSGTAKFNVGDASKFIKFDGSDLTVDAGNFSLDSSGNMTATSATLTGTVTATAGEIGGFGISASTISSSNNSLIFRDNGQITGSAALFNGNIDVTGTGTIAAFTLGASSISSSGLLLKSSGEITGSKVDLTGGVIGGWELGDAKLIYNDSGTERLRLDAGTGAVQLDGDDGLGIVLGNVGGGVDLTTNTALPVFFGTKENGSRSVFRVGSASSFLKFDTGVGFEVSSSKLHIKTDGDVVVRKVDAVEGTIGGFTLDSTSISSSGLLLKSDGRITGSNVKFDGGEIGNFFLEDYLTSATNKTSVTDTSAGVYLGTDGFAAGTGNLILKSSGHITASAANITGDIVANTITATTAGQIGQYSLSNSALTFESSSGVIDTRPPFGSSPFDDTLVVSTQSLSATNGEIKLDFENLDFTNSHTSNIPATASKQEFSHTQVAVGGNSKMTTRWRQTPQFHGDSGQYAQVNGNLDSTGTVWEWALKNIGPDDVTEKLEISAISSSQGIGAALRFRSGSSLDKVVQMGTNIGTVGTTPIKGISILANDSSSYDDGGYATGMLLSGSMQGSKNIHAEIYAPTSSVQTFYGNGLIAMGGAASEIKVQPVFRGDNQIFTTNAKGYLQEDLVQAYVRLTGSFDADMYNFNSVLSDYNPAGPDTGSFQEFQFYRAKSFTGKHTRKMVGYHYQSHAGTNPTEASVELIQNAASTTKYGLYSELNGSSTNSYNIYLANNTGGSSNNYSIYSTNGAAEMYHLGPITANSFRFVDTGAQTGISQSASNMKIGDIYNNDTVVDIVAFGSTVAQFGDGEVTVTGGITANTINTGQGANELYDMNQNVMTTSTPTFADLTISDDLFVNDFARIDALRVGNTSTDPGDGNLYVEDYIYAPGLGTGTDNSVVILDSDNRLKTDEIDSRVWGTTLLDGSNGTNNELAVFTDSNSVEGVSTLTYDNQTLYVGNGDSLPRLFLDSTSSGGTWTAQGAHISLGETAGENASLSITYTGDGYGRIGMGDITSGVPDNGEIRFTYNTDLIEIPSANVEIHNALSIGHTGTPAGTLDVRSSSDTYMGIFRNTTSTDGDNSYILNLWHSQEDSTSDFDTSEHWIQFSDNSGTFLGEIIDEVTYSTFTGGHVSQIISGSATDNENEMKAWKPGMILKATGNLNVTGSTIGLAWPEVTVTTAEKDKAVMGVYNDIKPGSGSNWVGVYNNKNAVSSSTGDWGIGHNMHGLDPVKPALDYNAVGEGMMLVTDTNGNIETGDYICSSDRRGHGQKQDDDLLHNYTVAKATQPYNFASASNDADLGYKSVLIACTYHCG